MSTTPPEQIVLGLGGTVDYEVVLDSNVINQLISKHQIAASEVSNAVPITSERDLVINILAFLETGTGGERFVSDSKIIENFAQLFEFRITLGGTCVRAAMAMEVFGIASTLHLVSISDDVRRLLPQSSRYICSSKIDTFDPHLIIQFGENFNIESGDIAFTSPGPNRIIFTNDPPNRDLVISEELGEVLANAKIFMISGFNCIQDSKVLDDRITAIQQHLTKAAKDLFVFFEDAGYHIPSLSNNVREKLVKSFDVYSMNEDEMQGYLGRALDLLDVETMEIAFRELMNVIPAKVLVIHTKYWAIALGKDCEKFEPALKGGITMASTRYCFGDNFTLGNYSQISSFPLNPVGLTFAEDVNQSMKEVAVCVPAYSLNASNPTTIGLGDSFVGGFIAALVR